MCTDLSDTSELSTIVTLTVLRPASSKLPFVGHSGQAKRSLVSPKPSEPVETGCQIQRAAAAPLSSGRLLKAMAACGAARWMALTTASNTPKRLGGKRTPAPITTQS